MTPQAQTESNKAGIILNENMQRRFEKTVKQILVVEDEIIIAENIQRKLKKMGYAVPVIVSSGEEAIKKVKENNPDLVLMDIVIHGNMDGIETAEQIRSCFDIPIVYLTAFADEKTLERAKITEPFGYLVKPFKERELQITIEIALYKHKMEKRLRESERRLRESNQWLDATIKSLGEAVIATDEKGIIKIMNPFAEALTGWKRNDALGKPLTTIFNIISEETDKQIENPVTKAIREDIFYGLAHHTLLITKEGMRIPVDVIGSTIKDDRDSVIGIVLIFYDIIERKRIDDVLKISKH
jgi:PAS domain S-box-containing protein